MEKIGLLLGLYVCIAAIGLVRCDSTETIHHQGNGNHFTTSSTKPPRKILHFLSKFDTDTTNTDPYVSSPFSMPPYDSLPPYPLPDNTPPFCVNPPSTTTPLPPSATTPLPPSTTTNPPPAAPTGVYTPTPPPASTTPTPIPIPEAPPQTTPPTITPNPPALTPPYYEPSPPSGGSVPNPPYDIPSPSGSMPSPRFLPPIVFPPPTVPPPPRRTPPTALWCVAKAAVPDPIIREAMNYACASGADCDQIQPNGSCFMPNTLFAHASYAFNSYFQRTKKTGGTCDFGGTAILVTVDPSYDGCHFIYF